MHVLSDKCCCSGVWGGGWGGEGRENGGGGGGVQGEQGVGRWRGGPRVSYPVLWTSVEKAVAYFVCFAVLLIEAAML